MADTDNDIKIYHVKKIMSDADIDHLTGTFFDQCDNVISHSCDVYYYDEHTQTEKVLLIFRKKAMPINMMENAIRVFKTEAKKASSIRGKAGGKVVPNLVSSNVARVVNPEAFRSKVQYKNGTVSNYYVSNKVNSMIVGYFDKERLVDRHNIITHGLDSCRTTAFTQNHSQEWQTVLPLFQHADSLYKHFMPINHSEQLAHCSLTPQYQITKTAFSTVTVNYNWQTACHTDKGDFHNGYSVLIVAEEGKYNGGYLTYPQYGVAVDVRQGDFLLINPHLHHSNTLIIPIEEGKNFTRLSMVMYYRENIEKCQGKNKEKEKIKITLKDHVEKEPEHEHEKLKITLKNTGPLLIPINSIVKGTNKTVKIFIRPDTTDIKVVDEVLKGGVYQKYKLNFNVLENETWFDLGGNIGTFALYALAHNCKKVISYEPEPENCNIYTQNLSAFGEKWILNQSAIGITNQNNETVSLYLCKGNYNKYRHTLYHKRGRQEIKVSLCDFKQEMNKWKPDGVKIDIEGSEIDILENTFENDWKQWNTKKLVFEYSFDIDPSIPRFLKIIEELRKYFTTVSYSKVKDNELLYKHFPAMTIVYCLL